MFDLRSGYLCFTKGDGTRAPIVNDADTVALANERITHLERLCLMHGKGTAPLDAVEAMAHGIIESMTEIRVALGTLSPGGDLPGVDSLLSGAIADLEEARTDLEANDSPTSVPSVLSGLGL